MTETDLLAALVESVVAVRRSLGKACYRKALRAARKAIAEVALTEAERIAAPGPGDNVVAFPAKGHACDQPDDD